MATRTNSKRTSLHIMIGGVLIFLIGISIYWATDPVSSFSSFFLVAGILLMLAAIVLLGFSYQLE